MDGWTQVAPTVLAAFLASLVECVEAMTIVLAVGTVRGWRSAFAGTAAALAVLIGLTLLLGPALARLPVRGMQLIVGLLLLLFGMRWLAKAMLRAIGAIALHDETAVFRSQAANLRMAAISDRWGVDAVATATAFKAVLLEGIEVVFIVLAIAAGGGGLLWPAALGAAAAALLVLLVGLVVHRPLARVPENSLKFAVGVLIAAFGIYWTGEGLGIEWPGHDFAIPGLTMVLMAAGLLGVRLGRARRRAALVGRAA
jgi:uncharacterized membrane protein